jgi:predicted methyltransferase
MHVRLWSGSFAVLSLAVVACGGEATVTAPVAAPAAMPAPAAEVTAPNAPAAPAPVASLASARALTPDAIQAIVVAPDRIDADRKADVQRHPAELLAFYGVGPGMTVADLGAGGGYTTELLARAVGPTGKIYGQNDPDVLKRFAEKPWSARLSAPVNRNVVRSDRTLDDPLPPEAKNLDLAVNFLFYHDSVWLRTDRDKMNRAIFAALKPGGAYVIVDASAKDGHGVSDAKTLHRIEQSIVEAEVKKAGFTLAASSDVLRNPSDTRDWNSSPKEAGPRLGTEDRFALKFVKP